MYWSPKMPCYTPCSVLYTHKHSDQPSIQRKTPCKTIRRKAHPAGHHKATNQSPQNIFLEPVEPIQLRQQVSEYLDILPLGCLLCVLSTHDILFQAQDADHEIESIGQPLGNIPVFQTSAIPETLVNEGITSHSDRYPLPYHRRTISNTHSNTSPSLATGCNKVTRMRAAGEESFGVANRHKVRTIVAFDCVYSVCLIHLQRPALTRVSSFHCASCQTTETPKRRDSLFGPRTLCNVCGLVYAKRQARCKSHPSRSRLNLNAYMCGESEDHTDTGS